MEAPDERPQGREDARDRRAKSGEAAGVLLGGAQGGVGVGAVHAAGREVVDEGAPVVVVRAGPVVGGDADLGEEGEAKGGVEVEEGGGEGRPGVEVEGLGRHCAVARPDRVVRLRPAPGVSPSGAWPRSSLVGSIAPSYDEGAAPPGSSRASAARSSTAQRQSDAASGTVTCASSLWFPKSPAALSVLIRMYVGLLTYRASGLVSDVPVI